MKDNGMSYIPNEDEIELAEYRKKEDREVSMLKLLLGDSDGCIYPKVYLKDILSQMNIMKVYLAKNFILGKFDNLEIDEMKEAIKSIDEFCKTTESELKERIEHLKQFAP